MPGCVLRISGERFDVDRFLAETRALLQAVGELSGYSTNLIAPLLHSCRLGVGVTRETDRILPAAFPTALRPANATRIPRRPGASPKTDISGTRCLATRRPDNLGLGKQTSFQFSAKELRRWTARLSGASFFEDWGVCKFFAPRLKRAVSEERRSTTTDHAWRSNRHAPLPGGT